MENSISTIQKAEKRVVLLYSLWGAIAFTLGATEIYTHLPKPVLGMTLMLCVITLITIYNKNKLFKNWVNGIPFRYLTLFHFWRIFGGLAFLAYTDRLPFYFAHEAAIGDIISGFLSILIFVFYQNRKGYIMFNIVGLLDLLLALSLGMFNAIIDEPKVATLAHLPFTFILLAGVPTLIFSHIIAFIRLFNSKENSI